ncbi:protein of unknown function [Pseudomonas mediterranea]
MKDCTSSSLEMLLAGVYRPVPLMTTLYMVVSLICSGRKYWYRRTNTQRVFSHPGEADLASLYSDPPGELKLKTTGPAFIGAKFAINAGVWPILHKPRHKTLVEDAKPRATPKTLWERACSR